MAQKTDGNWDDVKRVVKNLHNGLRWEQAKGADAFMAVEDDWYERNKAKFFEWSEKGIPQQTDSISLINRAPEPVNILSTPDGKVWAIFKDNAGKFYREEISADRKLAEAATPMPAVVDEGRLMAQGKPPAMEKVVTAEKPSEKPKNKSW